VILRIDEGSPLPVYEQLRSQVASMVVGGVLRPGHRLPPIRHLARDLGLAGGTVARAFRELERDGWIETRGRHGTFVRAIPKGTARERARDLEEASMVFALRALQAGASADEAIGAARSAWEALGG
jgi:DNA-binding transcriptional regulator YhcF (GntR family)